MTFGVYLGMTKHRPGRFPVTKKTLAMNIKNKKVVVISDEMKDRIVNAFGISAIGYQDGKPTTYQYRLDDLEYQSAYEEAFNRVFDGENYEYAFAYADCQMDKIYTPVHRNN